MVLGKSLVIAALTAAAVDASILQQSARQTACPYVFPEIPGGFSTRRFADFSGNTPADNAATVLGTYNIGISNYGPLGDHIQHDFVSSNVAFGNGYLGLKVNAYSGSGSIHSSEIVTNDFFMYASVRTVLKSTAVQGIVEGNFFFLNVDDGSSAQEIDFEILTTTISTSNNPVVPPGIWATNVNNTNSHINTVTTIPFTFDPTADYHEYRIDWFGTTTNYYIDGTQVAHHTDASTTPTLPGHWVWNAWSSGDPNWSMGPPTADGIYQIRSFDIYTGYTSTC